MFKGFRKALFNLSLILVIVAAAGMIIVNYLVDSMSNGWYIHNQNLGFLFSIFVLMYLIFYTLLCITAFLKYNVKRKLCTASNFKILILSYLLYYPLGDQVSSLNSKIETMKALMIPSADTCSNPESPLNTFQKVINDGYNILCSKECPCSGNPMLYRNDPNIQIIDVEDLTSP